MPISTLLNPGDWLGTKPRIDPGLTPFEFHYRPDGAEIRLSIQFLLLRAGRFRG